MAKGFTKDLIFQASVIVVSAIIAEITREALEEVRKRRHNARKNPVGFVPNN